MKQFDVLIIGAGILGLTTAYELHKTNPSLKIGILEKELSLSQHQTGRNSGVIHSGIYYKPGSLKASLCHLGKKLLIDFCDEMGIPYKKCGKLLVATNDAEEKRLVDLKNRGEVNGLLGLHLMSSEEIREREPHVYAQKGLWVSECSIVHYPNIVESLRQFLEKQGHEVLLNRKVLDLLPDGKDWIIRTLNDEYRCRFFVNCAGLFSDRVAQIVLPRKELSGQILPFRGEYFEIQESRRDLVKGLIYPVPDPAFPFLGVHLTRRMDGSVEAGPNAVLALAREGYRKKDINFKDCIEYFCFKGFWKVGMKHWKTGAYEVYRSLRKKVFLRDLRKLVPELKEEDLVLQKAGIRAQFVLNNGKLMDDFVIEKRPNMVHVLNAPSPAATASFAIGKAITKQILL